MSYTEGDIYVKGDVFRTVIRTNIRTLSDTYTLSSIYKNQYVGQVWPPTESVVYRR